MKRARLWTIWLLILTVTTASLLCCCVDKVFAKTLPPCHMHKMAKSNPLPCDCTKKLSIISSEFVTVDIAIKDVPQNIYFFDISHNTLFLAQAFLPQWSHDPPGLTSAIPLYIKNPTLRI